jgi:hypothetical protein
MTVVECSFSSCQRVPSCEGWIVQEQEQDHIWTFPDEDTMIMCWQVMLDLQLKMEYPLVGGKTAVCKSSGCRIGPSDSSDLPIIYHLKLERLGTIHHTNQYCTGRIHMRHFPVRPQTPRCCVVLFCCATRFWYPPKVMGSYTAPIALAQERGGMGGRSHASVMSCIGGSYLAYMYPGISTDEKVSAVTY